MAARVSDSMVWLVALALLVAACGGGDGGGGAATEQQSAATGGAQSEAAAAAPTEPEQDDADGSGEARTYVVQAGDTLSAIAAEFDTTVAALVRANDIADPDVIDIGQELTIP